MLLPREQHHCLHRAALFTAQHWHCKQAAAGKWGQVGQAREEFLHWALYPSYISTSGTHKMQGYCQLQVCAELEGTLLSYPRPWTVCLLCLMPALTFTSPGSLSSQNKPSQITELNPYSFSKPHSYVTQALVSTQEEGWEWTSKDTHGRVISFTTLQTYQHCHHPHHLHLSSCFHYRHRWEGRWVYLLPSMTE